MEITSQVVDVSLNGFSIFNARPSVERVQKLMGNRSAPESPDREYRYVRLLGWFGDSAQPALQRSEDSR